MRSLIYITLILFSISPLLAQRAHMSLNKSSVEIGVPFELTLSFTYNQALDSIVYTAAQNVLLGKISQANGVSVNNKTYELEISKAFSDTLYKENNTYHWLGKYELIAWDSAYVMINDQSIVFEDSLFYFNPVIIEVKSPIADGTKGIYDIKEFSTELEEAKPSWLVFLIKHWWWLSIILVLLFILIILQLKKAPVEAQKKRIITKVSPKESALKAIKALEESRLYETDLKEYYYQLSIIIRAFLSRHYASNFMDNTTHETKLDLIHRDLSDETISIIVTLLSQADMVKFAKSKPELDDILRTGNKAKQIVSEIAEIELKLDDN
ncbi:hypothetical protein SAMN05216474_1840 [Lishizhenia tianjinensis]|uniref:Oxygen tolerance n=1 Tax=Lishizhenia tianjinensis TaxID=477690 RepID=A0A1I7A2J4_9FLAO|nr:hypothetical protein [Lishizhenia tianjinensis]SFT69139.1 hypothetical protein SAMN05216474_1840 [Lishizhenia tianjinensis]